MAYNFAYNFEEKTVKAPNAIIAEHCHIPYIKYCPWNVWHTFSSHTTIWIIIHSYLYTRTTSILGALEWSQSTMIVLGILRHNSLAERMIEEDKIDFIHLRDMFFEEVDANGFLVISGKNALAVALNHARFSDGSIANDYHLQRRGSRFHFWYLGVSSLLYWHLYQTIHPVSLIIFLCFKSVFLCVWFLNTYS